MQKGSQMKPLSSYESGQAMLPPIPAKYPFPYCGFISKGTNLTNTITTKTPRIKVCKCKEIGKTRCATFIQRDSMQSCNLNETTSCNNVWANDTELHTVIECNEFNCCLGRDFNSGNRYPTIINQSTLYS